MDSDLLRALQRKRPDYDDELVWHRFLFDSYAGTGGFEGKVRMPPNSFWGPGADAYSRSSWDREHMEGGLATYLDQYPREDAAKFSRRVAKAHYPNPVEPVVDIRLSYLHRKATARVGVENLKSFLENATGHGEPWDRLRRDVIDVRAEVLGWTPVLLDVPPAPVDGPLSREQAVDLGLLPRAIPLFPANLYDWSERDGQMEAAKVVTWWSERTSLLEDPVSVTRYAIWTRNDVSTWETVKGGENGEETLRAQAVRSNPWGFIPLVIFRHAKAPEDAVRGISLIRNVAKLAKRLFNYHSELDEILSATTFPMLQVPTKPTAGTTASARSKLASFTIGTGNALPVPSDSTRDYKWLSPDTSAAEVYERRIEECKSDIRSIARLEYASADAAKVQKAAMTRAFEFENMNRALVDTAQQFAAAEEDLFRKVDAMNGGSAAEEIRCTAPERFDVEEMAAELERTLKAMELPLGPTAHAELLKRFARTALPNIEPSVLETIDSEIDDEQMAAQQEAAALRETRMNPEPEPGEDDPPGTKQPPPPEA